jgi:hypothetical protein
LKRPTLRYLGDTETDACECRDYEHNLPTADGRERCKHRPRVAFVTGETPIPAWTDTDGVDESPTPSL